MNIKTLSGKLRFSNQGGVVFGDLLVIVDVQLLTLIY